MRWTIPDLRAEIARRQLTLYEIAPAVRAHPGRLGMMLNERLPMPATVRERLLAVLQVEDGESVAAAQGPRM